MLIQLTRHAPNAPDIDYLLSKHPGAVFERGFSAGRVVVFYPDVADDRVTVVMVTEIDPVGLVRFVGGEPLRRVSGGLRRAGARKRAGGPAAVTKAPAHPPAEHVGRHSASPASGTRGSRILLGFQSRQDASATRRTLR